jgi:hypothetical protein
LAGNKIMRRRRKENNMIKKTVKRNGNRKGKMGRRLTAEGGGKNKRGRWGKDCGGRRAKWRGAKGRGAKGGGERRRGKIKREGKGVWGYVR